MELKVLTCPQCGAMLEMGASSTVVCAYCNSQMVVSGAPPQNAPPQSNEKTNGIVLRIDDVFRIAGKGTVVTGKTEATVSVGDKLALQDVRGNKTMDVIIDGITAGTSTNTTEKTTANAGELVILLLRDVARDVPKEGMLLVRGTLPPKTKGVVLEIDDVGVRPGQKMFAMGKAHATDSPVLAGEELVLQDAGGNKIMNVTVDGNAMYIDGRAGIMLENVSADDVKKGMFLVRE